MRSFVRLSAGRRLAAIVLGSLAALGGVTVFAGAALAATQLPTPGTPVATQVTQTSAAFTWTASAGPVRNYTIQVIDGNLVPWHELATTTGTTYTHVGLTPDKVYIYRVIANPTSGSGYTASNPSAPLYVTTAPLPDTIPPSKPATPVATFPISTTFATIATTGSTDNNRVAGYWVQRQVNGVWTDWATNNIGTIYLRQLTPSTTYTVVVVAFDPNGNRSPRSDPVTFTTRATEPAPTCRVQRQPIGQQQYILNFTVENMTAATVLSNWTVTFTLPAAHTVFYAFNATLTRSGDVGTLTPMIFLSTIGPGGSATFGLNAARPAGTPLPSGFTLNSAATGPITCTVTG
jgi:hypothetical protein